VQLLLGHESIVTTERYTTVDDDEIPAAMEAAGFVGGPASRSPGERD
jgi:integrase